MKRYEFVEHTADIAIKAFGQNIYEALEIAGRAFFDIITDNSEISPEKEVSFIVGADDNENMVVSYLSQLIIIFELDNMIISEFKIEPLDDFSLRCIGFGEQFDDSKHRHGHHIKGVSYHMLEIYDDRDKKETSIQVLFDV